MTNSAKLIDLHQHLGLDADEFDLIEVPTRPQFDSWLVRAVKKMPPMPAGSLRALLPPIYYQTTNGIEDVRRLNDLMMAALQHPALAAVAAFGIVEPQHGDASLEEIDRIAGKLTGIAFTPRAQGVYVNTQMAHLVKHAAQRGLLTMIHVTPMSGNEALWRLWHLADECADVPIVALGALANWDTMQSIGINADRARNIFYDTAGLSPPGQLAGLIDRLGQNRFLFGSGAHDTRDAVFRSHARENLAEENLPDALHQRVLWDNAYDLLKVATR